MAGRRAGCLVAAGDAEIERYVRSVAVSVQGRDGEHYRVFVGAFPGGEIAARIQALREQYDPATAGITPPHVTLAGTYWRSGPPVPANEAPAIAGLQALRGQVARFELGLGGIGVFPPAARPVIYLGVDKAAGLLAARRALIQALGTDQHVDYVPHLTLAMRLNRAAAAAMLAGLRAGEWRTGHWTVTIDDLWLMQRGTMDPSWRRIARLALE
jgi:2'-5' RNA ligase